MQKVTVYGMIVEMKKIKGGKINEYISYRKWI